MKIFEQVDKIYRWIRPQTVVYSLVGASGTGKSFRALLIAEKHSIPFIIDDGLLIHNQAILAGKSAKKEAVYVKAIKTAVFDEAEHQREVKAALREQRVERILIIGTSERMVALICVRLGLPPPQKIIRIEEVASEKEILLARRHRQEGKHVIPVPTVILKLHYPHMLAHKVRVFIGELSHRRRRKTVGFEKSIVRPHFHRGKPPLVVSERALKQMVYHCVNEFNSQIRVARVKISAGPRGSRISLVAILPYGIPLAPELARLRAYTIEHIERFAGIAVEDAKVTIAQVFRGKSKKKGERGDEKM